MEVLTDDSTLSMIWQTYNTILNGEESSSV